MTYSRVAVALLLGMTEMAAVRVSSLECSVSAGDTRVLVQGVSGHAAAHDPPATVVTHIPAVGYWACI